MSSEPYVPSEVVENIIEAMELAGHSTGFARAQIAKVRAGAKVEALREAAEEWRKQNYALGEFDG